MSDDLTAEQIQDICYLSLIAERFNALGFALASLERTPWPGATKEEREKVDKTLKHIILEKEALMDKFVEVRARYCRETFGLEAKDNRRPMEGD